MSDELYYVIDISRERRGDVLMFWGPSNRGYTTVVDRAGKYTRAQIEALPDYYNNGEEAIAVPCSEIESHAVRVVSNCSDVRQAIRAARLK